MAASTTSLSLFLLLCGLCFSPSVQQQDGSSFYFKQVVFLKPSTTDLEYDISFIYGFGGEATTLAVGALGDQGDYIGVWQGAGYPVASSQTSALQGAVYIFRRNFLGKWQQTAFLKPHYYHHISIPQFGERVAVEEDILVVAAESSYGPARQPSQSFLEGSIQQLSFPSDSWNTTLRDATGAVYVFLRERNDEEGGEDERWRQEAFIGPPIGSTETGFGSSLAITEEKIMVGGMQLDDSSMVNNPQRYSDSYNCSSRFHQAKNGPGKDCRCCLRPTIGPCCKPMASLRR